MQITILGSGTCVPSKERSAACIRVVADSTTVLLDSGPGSLHQMVLAGTTINDIDLLCYTHLHIDHTADLVPLLFASKYSPQQRTADLPIMAAPGFRDFYHNLTHAYGDWIIPQDYAIKWIEMINQPFTIDPFSITTAPVCHTPDSIAFRLQDSSGNSMVYSGDTDYCDTIVELALDCDVLILECSFPEGKHKPGHLTPELAGKIAAESRCRELVLTHFYPDCDPQESCEGAAKHYDGRIIAAHDMLTINT
jgi:ribonuclease BN (tRNA processing enzyme)